MVRLIAIKVAIAISNHYHDNSSQKGTMNDLLKKPNGSIDTDAYKGLTGVVDVNGMKVSVIVTDARVCYGRFDLCVEPKQGRGFRWIDYRNVELSSQPKPSSTSTEVISTTPTIREMIQSLTEKAK
jgi:hypothetical protein